MTPSSKTWLEKAFAEHQQPADMTAVVRAPSGKSNGAIQIIEPLEKFPLETGIVPFSSMTAVRGSAGQVSSHVFGDQQQASYFGVTITRLELIFTSCFGRSPELVGTLPIFSTTSRLAWSAVLPKTVYWRSRCGTRPRQMKNCEPAEFGSFVRAIERMPASCSLALNSCLIV